MFTDILQPTHLLFVLIVALLVLGPKRLPEVARTLGNGLRDFRDAISGESDDGSRPGHVSLGDSEHEYVPPPAPSGEMPIPREPDPSSVATEPAEQPAATAVAEPALEPTRKAASAEPITEPTAAPDDSAVPVRAPEPATEVRPPEPDHRS